MSKKRKKVIFVSGLPRSGSTLLCQLLAQHPEIYSSGHSSPVAHSLAQLRRGFSNDDFLLSQLDHDFDRGYERITNACRGFFDGWFGKEKEDWVVDKNRSWLGMLDMARAIAPECYFIVNVRELSQLFGSIESQHRKTVLLNSADGAADKTPNARAAHYFNAGGMVASCISNAQSALTESRPEELERIKVLHFERLMADPANIMNEIYAWLGLSKHTLNPKKMKVMPRESDSFYRFKFTHQTYDSIRPPKAHWVADSIKTGLMNTHTWFYKEFYPEFLAQYNDQAKNTK